MSAASDVLDNLEKALTATHNASIALIKHTREEIRNAAARAGDDDDWLRLPTPKARCPISSWSRSTVMRRMDSKDVRSKSIGKMRYYSGADVRKYISKTQTEEGA